MGEPNVPTATKLKSAVATPTENLSPVMPIPADPHRDEERRCEGQNAQQSLLEEKVHPDFLTCHGVWLKS